MYKATVSPKSLISDNHPVHHVRGFVDRIRNAGVLVCFLPPYTPDLNPIEEAYAQVKDYLRRNDAVLHTAANHCH